MRIAVIGLGKIGLPLAVQFASRQHDVVGVDITSRTVDSVNRGDEPFPGEAGLGEQLSALVSSGNLRATTDYADAVPGADAIVVVVPLFVDATDAPDFASLDSATASIGEHLTAETLVVYETTLPVGTTRSRWSPALEAASGLQQGRDFHVAFSPERVLTGRVFEDLRKYPKVIGCLSAEGSRVTTAFYESVLEFDERPDLARATGVWDLGSPEAAELTKLAETTYRDVNIALANQFALFAERAGLDLDGVVEAANSQPYSHIHRPGISVGGHCIPVYPRLYLWGDPGASLVRTAREINSDMPRQAAQWVADNAGKLEDARIAVLGAAYRGGVRETAFSGVFDLVAALRDLGAVSVGVHDPLYSASDLCDLGLPPHRLGEPVDVVVVHTDHPEYRTLTEADLPGVSVLLDGRGITQAWSWRASRHHILGRATIGEQRR